MFSIKYFSTFIVSNSIGNENEWTTVLILHVPRMGINDYLLGTGFDFDGRQKFVISNEGKRGENVVINSADNGKGRTVIVCFFFDHNIQFASFFFRVPSSLLSSPYFFHRFF